MVALVTTGVKPLWKPVPVTVTVRVWPATIAERLSGDASAR